jgi:cold shock CspA family protein
MNSAVPIWSTTPEQFAGDIGAAVSLDRSAWEQHGANFVKSEEEFGQAVLVAAGTIETSIGETEFGVLDYGAESTYLLAPATGVQNQQLTAVLIEALAKADVLSIGDVLDERSPYAAEESLAQRVAVLEHWAGEVVADATTTAVPVALDVEIPAHYSPSPDEPFYVVHSSHSRRQFHDMRYYSTANLERHIGTIKWFDSEKGLGAIEPRDGGKEVVLASDEIITAETPVIGKIVTFRYGLGPKRVEEDEKSSPLPSATDPVREKR